MLFFQTAKRFQTITIRFNIAVYSSRFYGWASFLRLKVFSSNKDGEETALCHNAAIHSTRSDQVLTWLLAKKG